MRLAAQAAAGPLNVRRARTSSRGARNGRLVLKTRRRPRTGPGVRDQLTTALDRSLADFGPVPDRRRARRVPQRLRRGDRDGSFVLPPSAVPGHLFALARDPDHRGMDARPAVLIVDDDPATCAAIGD